MTLTVPSIGTANPAMPAAADRGFLGVVMLDTKFPRLPGDIGHPDAFGVPTNLRVVKGVWPDKVVASSSGLHGGGSCQRSSLWCGRWRVTVPGQSPPVAAFWCCCKKSCRPLSSSGHHVQPAAVAEAAGNAA